MKAKLKYDAENKRVVAHLENCPRPDGSSDDFAWVLCQHDQPFIGQGYPSEEMMRGMDGQEMEVKDAERLWELQQDKQVSVSAVVRRVPSEKSPYDEIRQCIGLLNSMVKCGEEHSDVSREMIRKAIWALDELEGGAE
jgi:hypothetical protein